MIRNSYNGIRNSYNGQERCMVPLVPQTLAFGSNNEVHRPMIRALDLTPLIRENVNHYGRFDLDISTRMPIKWVVDMRFSNGPGDVKSPVRQAPVSASIDGHSSFLSAVEIRRAG